MIARCQNAFPRPDLMTETVKTQIDISHHTWGYFTVYRTAYSETSHFSLYSCPSHSSNSTVKCKKKKIMRLLEINADDLSCKQPYPAGVSWMRRATMPAGENKKSVSVIKQYFATLCWSTVSGPCQSCPVFHQGHFWLLVSGAVCKLTSSSDSDLWRKLQNDLYTTQWQFL